MLDNMNISPITTPTKTTAAITMSPTTTALAIATAAAPSASVEKREDVNRNTNASTVLSPTKAKTIFNWLKSATKTFDSSAERSLCGNNNHRHSGPSERSRRSGESSAIVACTCETVGPPPPTAGRSQQVATGPESPLREYRGVQGLRHLWNRRISANDDSLRNRAFGNSKVNKLTKSVSCLINAANAADSSGGNADNLSDFTGQGVRQRRPHTKRAQSLHDCTQLEEASQTDSEFLLHREKDNFYKYKTAEQASKHLGREVTKTRAKMKRLTAGIASGSVGEDAHFPAFKTSEKGERIQWLKRQDIVSKRREERLSHSENADGRVKMAIKDNKLHNNAAISLSADGVISNRNADMRQTQTTPTAADSQSERSVSSDTDTLTAANSPQRATSRKRNTDGEASAPSSKRGSTDSSISNAPTGRATRRTHSSAARKYSFKTHSRTFHTSRKMNSSTNKDGSAGSNGIAGYSMVAKLTQQFNEIIQKDKKLLEEVKRKNGVLMSRGGHVYKVVENTDLSGKNGSPSLSRNGSRAKDMSPRTSVVQRNIKKFENGTVVVVSGEKPAVPAKSSQVMRKRNELVSTKSHTSLSSVNLKRLPQQQSNHAELQLKLELKKQQVANAPLEMVKEETKTPLDTEDKSFTSAADSYSETDRQCGNRPNICNKVVSAAGQTEAADDVAQPPSATETETDLSTATQTPPQTQPTADNNDVDADGDVDLGIYPAIRTAAAAAEEVAAECATVTTNQLEQKAQRQESDVISPAAMHNKIIGDVGSASAELSSSPSATAAAANDADLLGAKVKQRKYKYAKIYEKFRFRSPFSGAHGKKSTPSGSPEKQQNSEKEEGAKENEEKAAFAATDNCAAVSAVAEPEAKILDALQMVDQKLKGLSADVKAPLVLCEHEDFEQCVLPNSSFVYQTTDEQVSHSQLTVTQAVNVSLVNSIEGEQMIMEEKDLLKRQRTTVGDTESELVPQTLTKTEAAEGQDPVTPMDVADDPEEPLYEPIATANNEPKTDPANPQQSFLYKSCGSSEGDAVDPTAEDIYQTMAEVHAAALAATTPTTAVVAAADLLNDYESIAGSCEQTAPGAAIAKSKSLYDYGYEICEPPPDEPTTPVPAAPALPTTSATATATATATIMRNTYDELPELPKPKRRLPKSPMPGKRPPKPAALAPTTAAVVPAVSPPDLLPDNDDQHYYADDENIYDTIKGSHCYESLHTDSVKLPKCPSKAADTVSLTSNCYESITHYRRHVTSCGHTAGSSSGSTLTISSDHKTNSLYEVSLAAGMLYGTSTFVCGTYAATGDVGGTAATLGGSGNGSGGDCSSNNYTHSNAASSDNSDEWVDISDAELDGANARAAKQQFIVVRERSKAHRSPDWSKRVRDKRLHQNKAISCIEDDSDHYYESLSPLGSKRYSAVTLVEHTSNQHKRNQDLLRYATAADASQRVKKYSASAPHAVGTTISDDYDSFDTDTDEIYETEENMKNHNDSGVDIRNVKLPDPPPPTNQVYAIVKKFKNFISNKKSPSSAQKQSGSQQKLYENSSQFYVDSNIYENTPKSKSKTYQKPKNKKVAVPSTPASTPTQDDIYENTEFHTLPTISVDAKQLSTSEKNLSTHSSNTELVGSTLRSKSSKSGKSFKSRLRKSLVGSTFETKQLSALTPTRSTFYIEDPSHSGSGELDSGFSEKTSSGDLTLSGTVPTPESQKFSTITRKAKKEAKTNNSQRRRTTIGIRPHEPPPPPPEDAYKTKQGTAGSTTSWYAECGVFKNGSTSVVHDEHSLSGVSKGTYSQNGSVTTHGTSWYAEAGLYQTSGDSVASSSGSSGVSTGNEGGLGDDVLHSMFLNEPLYQIYSAAKLESISRDMEYNDGHTDGYEEIGHNHGASDVASRNEDRQKRARPTALQLVGPKNGPSRTLWSEIPEVINSCILLTLTSRERGLQEAKFEIVTSEASYLKSLNLLRSHFMNHPLFRDTSVVSASDRKALFSYIVPVHECSERLLTELESCWQDNIMLLGLGKRIYAIAERHFHVYIAFCEHQGRMDRTLRRLKEAKGTFSQNLDLLEASPTCCGLNLHSFLMLPMQRITRLPLLIDAVFSKMCPSDDEYDNWKLTLAIMNKIVTQCNEAANRCEQAYEIERISRQLEFPTSIRALAIAPVGMPAAGSKPRFLVKKGELTHLIWRGDDAKLTFGKKFSKSTIFAFLFSDLLVLTKRRGEEQFAVFDYCPRNMLTISSDDALPQLPTKDLSQTSKNLILMTLLENHERKTVELVLSCPSVSEQERWLQAMRPPEAETPGEKLYEQWDCPQVIVKHPYETKEPDVLNLEMGDVVNVTRKLPDGWYQGERIRDGAVGWFPGSYTEEVNSAHVRARNLKQRYRLLTFTATYLEAQKRK